LLFSMRDRGSHRGSIVLDAKGRQVERTCSAIGRYPIRKVTTPVPVDERDVAVEVL
jgi:hypothetical protein